MLGENFPFQQGGTWFSNMSFDPGGYVVDEARFRQGALPEDMAEITLEIIGATIGIAQALKQAGLVGSTSEALRLIDGGGLKVNGERVADRALMLPKGEVFVAQAGKRRFARITLS